MQSVNINNLPKPLNMESFITEKISNNSIDIEFVYCSDFRNAKILRDFLEIICKLIWIPSREILRLVLIIDELNNNAIEYWSEPNWYNKLRIKTNKINDYFEIVIEVEDTWKWKKHKTALEMETLRAHQLKLWYWSHESIRWRWLFMIIVNSVDRLYFRDTDNWWLIVWVKKKIKI